MKESPTFLVTVVDGRMRIKDTEGYRRYMKAMDEGAELYMQLKPRSRGRSVQQNRWLWGAIYPLISEHTGHTPEELHEVYKRMFLPRRYVEYGETKVLLNKSTSSLNVSEFSDFVERIRAEAASLGIHVPDPE